MLDTGANAQALEQQVAESNKVDTEFTVTDYHSESKSVVYTLLFTPAMKPPPKRFQAPTSPVPSDYSDTSDTESEDESSMSDDSEEEDCTPLSSPPEKFEDFSEKDQIFIKLNIEIAMRNVKGQKFGNPQKWARPPVHPRVKRLRLEARALRKSMEKLLQ